MSPLDVPLSMPAKTTAIAANARHSLKVRKLQIVEGVTDCGEVCGLAEDEGDEVQPGQCCGQTFVVARQAAEAGHPGEGSPDHPPARQQGEAALGSR